MLKGRDVLLAPLGPDDSEPMYRWINQREEVLHSSPYRPVSRSHHDAWFEAVQKRSDTVIFAIRLVDSDRLIGSCQLVDIHPVHRSAELRIRIGETGLRGRGYGTQALRLLLAFGFRDLNLRRIWLHVFLRNERAWQIYLKLGFTEEGVLRQAVHIDGAYESIRVMSLLEEEYARRHSSA